MIRKQHKAQQNPSLPSLQNDYNNNDDSVVE